MRPKLCSIPKILEDNYLSSWEFSRLLLQTARYSYRTTLEGWCFIQALYPLDSRTYLCNLSLSLYLSRETRLSSMSR